MATYKKKEIVEVINNDGDLIGQSNTPESGADLESQANNTTDYNSKIGPQPFRYDMLGRFGFTLLPFFEGKEPNENQTEFLKDLEALMNERYLDILKHYYRNPNQLKSDYRKHVSDGEISAEAEKYNKEWTGKIINIIEKHFGKAFKNPETIDEGHFSEDKMIDKKSEKGITHKSDDKDVREKKLEKIAGLINKLDKKDYNELVKLLERK